MHMLNRHMHEYLTKYYMYEIMYFIIGLVISICMIKLVLHKPIKIKVAPNLDNLNDVTYIDEKGTTYKYTLVEK